MYKVIALKNFRGFRDTQLVSLSRINVITGLNGAGKTSLLEAAFLISGGANASNTARIYGFRGNTEYAPDYDKAFRWLFRHLDPDSFPLISASTSSLQQRTKKHYRELRIEPEFAASSEHVSSTENPRMLNGVVFKFKGPSGAKTNKWGWIHGASDSENEESQNNAYKLGGSQVDNPDHKLAHFVSPYVRDIGKQDHDMVVSLVKEKRIEEAVSALKMIEPELVDLVPLTEHAIPSIYVDVGEDALLPISLLGSGLSNCLRILLPSILHRNAVILIDEFEDGLHHSIYRPLLDVAFRLARENNNQLFVTSHSNEFLRAVISTAQETGSQDISFYRLSRRGMQGVIPQYSLSEAASVLDSNLDIR